MDNQFNSNGGRQNNYGISPALFAEYVSKLAVTEAALASFLRIVEKQQVSVSALDSRLRKIAANYKELLLRLETVQSEDPEVVKLKQEARQAIEAHDYAEAEVLLRQAEERDMQAIEVLLNQIETYDAQAIEEIEKAVKQRRISAVASCVENAMLQCVQLRYDDNKTSEYWLKAANVLPQENRQERSIYLYKSGYERSRYRL